MAFLKALAACFQTVGSSSLTPDQYPAKGQNGGVLGNCIGFARHDVGFFVNRHGGFWAYSSCGCLGEGKSFHVVPFGSAEVWRGATVLKLGERGISSNLVVGVADRPPPSYLKPGAPPSPGDKVYAIGIRDNQPVVTRGSVIEIGPGWKHADGIARIVCEMQAYHGFCGGPLIAADGGLIGFGASIEYRQQRAASPFAKRRFDIAVFESADALEGIAAALLGPQRPTAKILPPAAGPSNDP